MLTACHRRILLFILTIASQAVFAQRGDALSLSKRVADKVITDTKFEWKRVPQKEELGMHVVDFRFLALKSNETGYALRRAIVKKDTLVRIGINSSGKVKIFVNDIAVWEQQKHEAA